MAELDIGKHCTFHSCKQLDFLPFECAYCNATFCKHHKDPSAHECPKKDDVPDLPSFTGEKSHACDFAECSRRELTPIVCHACHKNFCLSHRHQTGHACEKYEAPKERMTKTKDHVQKIVESKPAAQKAGQGRKSKATSAKVALMKIKMKALGDKGTPESERVYLRVLMPKGSISPDKPMFFSKKWSVGRVIDQSANLSGIENQNNVTTAKKLRLFDPEHGTMLPLEPTLEALMGDSEMVVNGGTVILEYVSDDITQLTHLHSYQL